MPPSFRPCDETYDGLNRDVVFGMTHPTRMGDHAQFSFSLYIVSTMLIPTRVQIIHSREHGFKGDQFEGTAVFG